MGQRHRGDRRDGGARPRTGRRWRRIDVGLRTCRRQESVVPFKLEELPTTINFPCLELFDLTKFSSHHFSSYIVPFSKFLV